MFQIVVFIISLTILAQSPSLAFNNLNYACRNLNPGPSLYRPSRFPTPFCITVKKTSVVPGEALNVTISSCNRQRILNGFMVQAQIPGSRVATGSFAIPRNDRYAKPINCFNGFNNTAIMKNTITPPIQNVTLTWIAPKDYLGPVFFNATVLKVHEYWTNLTSAQINVGQKKKTFPWFG